MTRPRPTRRTARENAMQMLFQTEANPEPNRDIVKTYFREQMRFKELEAFALSLFDGVQENRQAIDERLQRISENWRLGRMAAVDRAILRLATYEICHSQCPPKVAINEALEISKRYSDTDSPAYINGVLDKVLKEHIQALGTAPSAAAAAPEPGSERAAVPEAEPATAQDPEPPPD